MLAGLVLVAGVLIPGFMSPTANINTTARVATAPNSSPIMAKIKSVCASGR